MNVRKFHIDIVKKKYRPLKKGVEQSILLTFSVGRWVQWWQQCFSQMWVKAVVSKYIRLHQDLRPWPAEFQHSKGPVWNPLSHYQRNNVRPWLSLRMLVQGQMGALWLWTFFQAHLSHVIRRSSRVLHAQGKSGLYNCQRHSSLGNVHIFEAKIYFFIYINGKSPKLSGWIILKERALL